ncbi:hypothetical protein [Marivivens marinus]|uniref:hypothetical protein n=1 Tax=Marivivens marinus TaxID=3110173 RepID=UPI003B846F73
MTDPQSATFPFVDRHTKWLKPPYRDLATLIQMKSSVVTLNTDVTIKRGFVAQIKAWVSLLDPGVIAGRYEQLEPLKAQGHGLVDTH